MSQIKRLSHSFYFFKVKCICSHSLFSFSCYVFVKTIFKMKPNTIVTKYTDILIFSFAHIYPQQCMLRCKTSCINTIFIYWFQPLMKYWFCYFFQTLLLCQEMCNFLLNFYSNVLLLCLLTLFVIISTP